jgi:hypothetical protein
LIALPFAFGINSISPTGTNKITAIRKCDNSWIIIPGKKRKDKAFMDINPERVLLINLESKNKTNVSIKSRIKYITPLFYHFSRRRLKFTFLDLF